MYVSYQAMQHFCGTTLKRKKHNEEISFRMVDGNKLWTNHMLCPNIMENPYSKETLLAHIHYYFIPGAFHVVPTGIFVNQQPKLLRI